ncbi:MAG: hypothetical protein AAB092_02360, partial [Chloroflexota bacterium]
MSLKTKPKPTRRAGGYRSRAAKSGVRRPSVRRKKSSSFNLPKFAQGQLGWAIVWVGVTAGLSVIFFNPLRNGVEAVLETLGLGVLLIVAAVVMDVRVALRRPDITKEFLRLVAGCHLMLVFAFGAASMIKPDWTVEDVRFAETSLGGDFGRLLTGSPIGVLGWLAAAGAGL